MTSFEEIEAIETLAAGVVQLLTSTPPVICATERFERFNPALPWLHFTDRTGVIIGVAWGSPVERSIHLARTVAMARGLRKSPLGATYRLTEGFGTVSPRLQRAVTAISGAEHLPLRFAAATEIRWAERAWGPVTAELLRSPVRVSVELGGITGAILPGVRIFFDTVVLHGPSRHVRSRRWRLGQGSIDITVEDDTMSTERAEAELLNAGVRVAIDIGAFEMALRDLLALRPGAIVELPCPEPMRGVLKVEGAVVGLVSLSRAPDTLMATIDEMQLFGPIEKKPQIDGNGSPPGPMREEVNVSGGSALPARFLDDMQRAGLSAPSPRSSPVTAEPLRGFTLKNGVGDSIREEL